jgi:colanic acid/amylovoran biosynthesis protein
MQKTYAITHCYTDMNKGDAAIIQSTINLLRQADPNGRILLYSTFGPKDRRFDKEHDYIEPMADALYPAILSNPQRLRWFPHEASRIFPLLINVLQSLCLLVSINPVWVAIFARGKQATGIRELARADVIISKGGSYLTSQNLSFRQAISLATMLYPFIFAIRYRCSCVIFSQSLGPINGRFNQFLFHQVLKRITRIYVREELCIREYESVRKLDSVQKSILIPDTAFFYKSPPVGWQGSDAFRQVQAGFDKGRLKIGITCVNHAFKYIANPAERESRRRNYFQAIVALVRHLRETQDAQIHIFPQVTVGNSHEGHNDITLSRRLASVFCDTDGDNVSFHEHDFSPTELRELYSDMDVFVGTRLHSVIFAVSTGCPAINIAYHGTKSKGVFSGFEALKENVIAIDTITANDLIQRTDFLIENRLDLRDSIVTEVAEKRAQLLDAMSEIVALTG